MTTSRLTIDQAVIVSGYTGILCCAFSALRAEIPRLIEQCLDCAPTHRFATVQRHRVIDITPPAAPAEEPPKRGLMRLLWGGR